MIQDALEELTHELGIELDPPVPPFLKAFFVIVVGLDSMVHRVNEACIRRKYIHRASYAKKYLIA